MGLSLISGTDLEIMPTDTRLALNSNLTFTARRYIRT